MKKLLILITLLGITFTGIAQFNNYNNGDTVHDFTVTDVYGKTHNLYDYTAAGKYVYLDFFYSACGGCQNFIPIFNEFYDKYGCNEGDLICISMNSGYDKDAEVIAFENTYGGSFHHAPAISIDGGCENVITDFDPMYYPAVCLIAPDNSMVNSNITPYNSVENLEVAFPSDFTPEILTCTLGAKDFKTPLDFTIFPNPANGHELTIMLNNKLNAQVKIVTILGKEVFAAFITQANQIIYPNLKKGAYILAIHTDYGIRSKKLIIK